MNISTVVNILELIDGLMNDLVAFEKGDFGDWETYTSSAVITTHNNAVDLRDALQEKSYYQEYPVKAYYEHMEACINEIIYMVSVPPDFKRAVKLLKRLEYFYHKAHE